jgi:hypothetical protein
MSSTTTSTTTTETVTQEIEGGLAVATDVLDAVDPPIGAVVTAGETAVEDLVNASPHASAVTDIENTVAAAAPVITAAAAVDPAVDAATADLKNIFGIKF